MGTFLIGTEIFNTGRTVLKYGERMGGLLGRGSAEKIRLFQNEYFCIALYDTEDGENLLN
jgi:hypothetical protein